MALPIYTSAAFTGTTGVELAPNASVEVRSEADDSLVTLYEDRDGNSQINNPFQADAFGRFQFFANPTADGWRITVTSGADSHTLRYQQPMIGPTIMSVRNFGARGDGVTDDTVAIQAAIDAAVAVGTHVELVFPEGDYLVATTQPASVANSIDRVLLADGDNVTFRGPGRLVFEFGAPDNQTVVLLLRGDNLTVDGLGFHNKYDASAGSGRSQNIAMGDTRDDGFDTTRTYKNVRVVRTRHSGPFFYAVNIAMSGSNSAVVDGVYIAENAFHGDDANTAGGAVNFGTPTTTGLPVRRVQILGNYAEHIPSAAAYNLLRVEQFLVANNIAYDCEDEGIQCENTAGRAVIANNILIECEDAIFVDDSQHVIVQGNVIENTTSQTNAIRVTREAEAVDYVRVQANSVKNGRIMVTTFGAGGGSFGTIVVADNDVELDGSTHNLGIFVAAADRAICRGNTVIGASTASITVSTQAGEKALVYGNLTAKAGAEASVGLNHAGAGDVAVFGNSFENGVSGNPFTNLLDIGDGADPKFELRGIRAEQAAGSDVASASTITLGNGNYFVVTGTTTISFISGANWKTGATVTLRFAANPTITHGASGSGDDDPIFLAGSVNWTPTPGSTLTLVFDNGAWREIARTER